MLLAAARTTAFKVVNARKVFYALTPLVGAFNSGDVIGRALAGLEMGTCNVAPMFFCVPNNSSGRPILDFPRASDIGREMQLHLRNNQSETWTPGNFGFLDVSYGTNSQKNLKLGLNTAAAGCFKSSFDQTTETGSRAPEGKSLNTRLDFFSSPIKASDCDFASGDFCPSENVTKNWVNVQIVSNKPLAQANAATCASTATGSWQISSSVTGLPNPGYNDDASFSGPMGDGNWSASSWLTTNHPGHALSEIPDLNDDSNISRYEAYEWELSSPNTLLATRTVRKDLALRKNGNYDVTLYCAYPRPQQAPAWHADTANKDRRMLTVGAVNCTDDPPNGHTDIRIIRWVDLFLVKPVNVGSDTDFMTEVKGVATRPNGDSGFQYYGRKKAVLIR